MPSRRDAIHATKDGEGRERTMSATGAAIQVRRVRPQWSVLVAVVLAIGTVGFVAGRISERTTQPAPAAVTEQVVPISGLATSGEARSDIYQEIGQLRSLRVESPYTSETGLTKARIYEALGRLTAGSAGGSSPDFRRGLGASKSG
jgi:hypothetical protein